MIKIHKNIYENPSNTELKTSKFLSNYVYQNLGRERLIEMISNFVHFIPFIKFLGQTPRSSKWQLCVAQPMGSRSHHDTTNERRPSKNLYENKKRKMHKQLISNRVSAPSHCKTEFEGSWHNLWYPLGPSGGVGPPKCTPEPTFCIFYKVEKLPSQPSTPSHPSNSAAKESCDAYAAFFAIRYVVM